MYIHTYTLQCIYIYMYVSVSVYVYVYANVYVYAYVYANVCMYACMYTHTRHKSSFILRALLGQCLSHMVPSPVSGCLGV